MTKWEYIIGCWGFPTVQELDFVGAQGWELVTIVVKNECGLSEQQWIFKREKK